jgi:glycosyltransferase involved in cell wall biosynthesis
MIVKNNENILEECLKPLHSLGYELVIVDTGSTDNTRELALRYTDKVYDYPWNDNFAEARNYTIGKASNDFILMIDSDEIIESINKDKLKELILKNPDKIGRVLIGNVYTRGNENYRTNIRLGRLFSKDLYHYEGRIHEQVVARDGTTPEAYYDAPISILHKGYDGSLDTRKRKTQRNIELLLKELDDKGEDPYTLYQLGKSYYMQEDYKTACKWFDKALYFDLDTKLEYVQDMVESYGYALLNSEQYEKAMMLSAIYDEFAVNADFVFLMGLIYMNNAKFTEAIGEFIKATTMSVYKIDGVNSYRAYYNIGVIYECLGQKDKAKIYYRKAGEYEPALSRYNNIK